MLRPINTAADVNIGDQIGGRDLQHVWTVQAKIDDTLICQRYDKLETQRKANISLKSYLLPPYYGAVVNAYVVGNVNLS